MGSTVISTTSPLLSGAPKTVYQIFLGPEVDQIGHTRRSIAPPEAMLYRADPVQQSIAKPPRRNEMRRRLRGGSKGSLAA